MNGSVESFKHCKQLKELDITYPKLKEDFCTNIQLFVPELQKLRIETDEEFSDSFIDSFHSLKNIRKVILSYQALKYYFGKCLTEVMLSPKSNDVKRITNDCGLRTY